MVSMKELRSSTDHMSEAEADRSGTFCQSAAAPLPRQRPGRRSSSHVSIKTVRKHKPDLGVNGRRVGERHGRVRDDVRSAFALRGESENRSLVFSLLRLRRCRIQVPVSVAKGEYYPTCFAKHLLAQREVGRVCYGDAPFRDGAYWPCGDAHVFFARHLLARRVNVHL